MFYAMLKQVSSAELKRSFSKCTLEAAQEQLKKDHVKVQEENKIRDSIMSKVSKIGSLAQFAEELKQN